MNIVKSPLKFTPSNNPVVFGFQNTGNTVYMNVVVKENRTQSTLYTGKLFPTPIQPDTVYFNASKVLDSIVKYDVDNEQSFVKAKTNNILDYQLHVVPFVVSGNSITQSGNGIYTSPMYVWDAGLDIQSYTSLDISTFVVMTGNTSRFLTNQPNNKNVNQYSNEQLYILQDGYSGLTLNIDVNKTLYQLPITGTTTTGSTVIPSTPEVRAVAYIRVTGTTINQMDNIGVYVNGNLLGSYVSTTTANTATQLAAGIEGELVVNTAGYTISRTNDIISILAPVGTGVSGNSISLSTQLVNTGSTTIIYNGALATAEIGGVSQFGNPVVGSTSNVDVEDFEFGNLNLATYVVTSADNLFVDTYVTNLVNKINENPYGYTASVVATDAFRITARPNTGAMQNLYNVTLSNNVDTYTYGDFFGGGNTTSTGTTTTSLSIIPHCITGFTGGQNAVAEQTVTLFFNTVANMYRFNVSPSLVDTLTTLSVGDQYDVWISDTNNTRLSEVRTYRYTSVPCNVDLVNVIWVNSLGGVDSVQMLQPQSSVSIRKQTIQKNNIRMDEPSIYQTSGKWNASVETISTTNTTSFRCWTQPLSDVESVWLSDLVASKQVFIELQDGSLLPVQIVTSNYTIGKKRYIKGQLNQFQFEFELDSNYNPDISGGLAIN